MSTTNTCDANTSRFSLGIEIHETARVIRRVFDRRVRHLGFTQAQWRALLRLDGNPGISQVGLADILDIQPISLMRILDRLVQSGLVERRPDPNDRRAVKLFLTPQSVSILKLLHEAADEVRIAATQGLHPAELERVTSALRLMRANVEIFGADDAPAKNLVKQ